MSDGPYVQGGMFGGMTFAPLEFNPTFGAQPALPALPSLPGTFAPSQTSPGNVVTSQGGAGSSIGVDPTGAPANAVGTPNVPQTPVATDTGTNVGPASGSLADYFLRGVIIILGFIFVAIGLRMFAPSVVPDIRNVVRG